MLRLLDGTTAAPVPTRQERVEEALRHAEQARQHAAQERQHADTLADEVERLKALLEQTRGGASPGAEE